MAIDISESRSSSSGDIESPSSAAQTPVDIELFCLREGSHFVRRHPRYLLTLFWLYGYSLRNWRLSRLMRAAYCLVQHLDDVLDGDRSVDANPLDYVDCLIRSMGLFGHHTALETTPFEPDFPPGPRACARLVPLARYVHREALRYEARPGEFKENFSGLLETLRFDWQRRQRRQLLPAQRLSEQHRRTFEYSANLTLVLLQSRLRAADVPELIAALSWCSPIRDLQEDLEKGLVNIPHSVIDQAQANGNLQSNYAALRHSPAVRTWLRHEFDQAQYQLRLADIRLGQLQDDPASLLLSRLTKALRHFANKYARRNRDLFVEQEQERFG